MKSGRKNGWERNQNDNKWCTAQNQYQSQQSSEHRKSNVASDELCVTKQQCTPSCWLLLFCHWYWFYWCMISGDVHVCAVLPKSCVRVCTSDMSLPMEQCKCNNRHVHTRPDTDTQTRARTSAFHSKLNLFFTHMLFCHYSGAQQKSRMLVIHFLVCQLQKCRRWQKRVRRRQRQMYETTYSYQFNSRLLHSESVCALVCFGLVCYCYCWQLQWFIKRSPYIHCFPCKWCSKSVCRAWNEILQRWWCDRISTYIYDKRTHFSTVSLQKKQSNVW